MLMYSTYIREIHTRYSIYEYCFRSVTIDCNLIAHVKVMLRYTRSMRRQHSCVGPEIASIYYYGKTRDRDKLKVSLRRNYGDGRCDNFAKGKYRKRIRPGCIMLVLCKRNEARRAINGHLLFYSPLSINRVLFFSVASRPTTGSRIIIHGSIRRINFISDKCI